MQLERAITVTFDRIRLRGIRQKILAFSLGATLVPALTLGWISYRSTHRLLTDKLAEELKRVTSEGATEIDSWLGQHVNDLASASRSSWAIDPLVAPPQKSIGDESRRVVARFLETIQDRAAGAYSAIAVLDRVGEPVVSTSASIRAEVPDAWVTSDAIVPLIGPLRRDRRSGGSSVLIAQPITGHQGERIGLLVAELDLESLGRRMRVIAEREGLELYLITPSGEVLETSHPIPSERPLKLPSDRAIALFQSGDSAIAFEGIRSTGVIGMMHRIPSADWGVVAERDRSVAYAAINRIQMTTAIITLALVAVVGSVASLLALTLVRPLVRLTRGADAVAAGNLDVELPVLNRNEIGYLTEVFNKMVATLRETQAQLAATNADLRVKNLQLHELSITDGLTGLFARKYATDILVQEISRSRRYGHELSLLMIDIDHFKRYNDTFGHPAGDEMLVLSASVFRECIRTSDYASRYGGEEFLLLLPESGPAEAVYTAERIRRRVKEVTRSTPGGPITVSVGVASFPDHGTDAAELIQSADAALYRAKHDGRDRVKLTTVVANPQPDLA